MTRKWRRDDVLESKEEWLTLSNRWCGCRRWCRNDIHYSSVRWRTIVILSGICCIFCCCRFSDRWWWCQSGWLSIYCRRCHGGHCCRRFFRLKGSASACSAHRQEAWSQYRRARRHCAVRKRDNIAFCGWLELRVLSFDEDLEASLTLTEFLW